MINYALPKYRGTVANVAACAQFEQQGNRGEKARNAKRLKAKQAFLIASQREAVRIADDKKTRRRFAHSAQVEADEFNPLTKIKNA